MSDSLRPHELLHSRLPCPWLAPRVCSNSCPLNLWYHYTVSFSVVSFLLLPSIFPSIRVFSSESSFCIRWLKYWSFRFSISPCNEYSGLISFRIDWLDCSPKGSQESSLTPEFENINSLALSLLYGPTLTSVHDYWKNHSLDYTDLCQQNDVFDF